MGISVKEYFEQKEACQHCLDHGNEDHCVTTLLSRQENCLIYNIIHKSVGHYTQDEIAALRNFRDSMSEEVTVNYYVRGENLIERMGVLEKPFYEQYSVFSGINHRYVIDIVSALVNDKKQLAQQLINSMLDNLEKEITDKAK